MIPVVPVYHQRSEARRAFLRGYPRRLGTVRCCRTPQSVERLLSARLVDAIVVDVKAAPELWLPLPQRFPRIPVFALSAFRFFHFRSRRRKFRREQESIIG